MIMANEKQLIDANDFYDTVIFTDADVFEMDANENYTSGLTRETIKRLLDEAPTVDAVEVVHGRWKEGYLIHKYGCSCCGVRQDKISPYCPSCGAKMDGGNEDG